MQYQFPVDMQLDEVRRVIRDANEELGANCFIEADRDDHVIFNYLVSFSNSFPFPASGDPARDRDLAIRRECRGLTFSKDGKLIARKFQKFFNVNEKEETQVGAVDWSRSSIILDKLDGSLITPMLVNQEIRFCTKMGLTGVARPVDEHAATISDYHDFCRAMLEAEQTPMFEWCSRRQRIVIDYPTDQLVLTAIRDNRTGAYRTYDEMASLVRGTRVPVVQAWGAMGDDIMDFIARTRGLKNTEGYIIRFNDGTMLKMKADEYCTIHKAKDELNLEKNAWAIYLGDSIDDVKAMLDPDTRQRLDGFADAMSRGIEATAKRLTDFVEDAKARGATKKQFATEIVPAANLHPMDRGLVFQVFEGADAGEAIRKILCKNTYTQPQVDSVRRLVGDVYWYSNDWDGNA